MGEFYELASELAEIAKAEEKTIMLLLRKDGTFQALYTEPEPFTEKEGAALEGSKLQKNGYLIQAM